MESDPERNQLIAEIKLLHRIMIYRRPPKERWDYTRFSEETLLFDQILMLMGSPALVCMRSCLRLLCNPRATN